MHRGAWADVFDPLLSRRGERPFSAHDYDEYVDGKPRADGVRDFLVSRGIRLPDGAAGEKVYAETVNGIADRKNELLLARIRADGVAVYPGSRRYLRAVVEAGLRCVAVSSSANTAEILHRTGLDRLVEERVDGTLIEELGMAGKPAPDSFLAAAALVAVEPAEAAVFEDALAGVQAGRDGGFGFVVGINRRDERHAVQLREHGADVVVDDLAVLLGCEDS